MAGRRVIFLQVALSLSFMSGVWLVALCICLQPLEIGNSIEAAQGLLLHTISCNAIKTCPYYSVSLVARV